MNSSLSKEINDAIIRIKSVISSFEWNILKYCVKGVNTRWLLKVFQTN
jgi:hypothetical protein